MTGDLAVHGPGLLEALLAVAAGIALAVAAGLRVFVPLFAVSLAGYTGHLALSPGTAWLGTLAAAVALGVAVVVEVVAYFVPALDHALDALGAPLAVAAGVLASAAMFVDFPPLVRWALAVVAGGGSAGLLHSSMALVRLKSGALTAGLGNPLVAAAELGGALVLAALALLVPVAALALGVAVTAAVARRVRAARRTARAAGPA